MKMRLSFVTNSSSSAFLIAKKYLSDKQMQAIRMHSELGQKLGLDWAQDRWNIDENEDFITGDTYMNNFCMSELFKIIGIPTTVVFWNEFGFDLNDLEDYVLEQSNEEEEEPDWQEALREITGEDF